MFKFSIQNSTPDVVKAEEDLVSASEEMYSAKQELLNSMTECKELNVVLENIDTAKGILTKYHTNVEALSSIDPHKELANIAGVVEAVASLESMTEKEVSDIQTKYGVALEGIGRSIWIGFKTAVKTFFAKIGVFFKTLWRWLMTRFSNDKQSWNEIKQMYELEAALKIGADTFEEIFSDPDIEKSMNNTFNDMVKDFQNQSVRDEFDEWCEKNPEFFKESDYGANTEGIKVSIPEKGEWYDYRELMSVPIYDQLSSSVRVLDEIKNHYVEISKVLDSIKRGDMTHIKEMTESSVDDMIEMCEKNVFEPMVKDIKRHKHLNITKAEFSRSPLGIDIEIEEKVYYKAPDQLGWNMKSCREFMNQYNQAVEKFNGISFDSIVRTSQELSEKTISKLEEIADICEKKGVDSSALSKLRSVINLTNSLVGSSAQITGQTTKHITRQVRLIQYRLGAIKIQLRKARNAFKKAD